MTGRMRSQLRSGEAFSKFDRTSDTCRKLQDADWRFWCAAKLAHGLPSTSSAEHSTARCLLDLPAGFESPVAFAFHAGCSARDSWG